MESLIGSLLICSAHEAHRHLEPQAGSGSSTMASGRTLEDAGGGYIASLGASGRVCCLRRSLNEEHAHSSFHLPRRNCTEERSSCASIYSGHLWTCTGAKVSGRSIGLLPLLLDVQ